MGKRDRAYDVAWVVIVREELADGRSPEQIAATIQNQAEWYIELAWRMSHEKDDKYERIRQHFADPREQAASDCANSSKPRAWPSCAGGEGAR